MMKLLEDGTAEVVLRGETLTIPSPTYGTLKLAKQAWRKLSRKRLSQYDSLQDGLTPSQKALASAIDSGKAADVRAAQENASREDLLAVSDYVEDGKDLLAAFSAEWWTGDGEGWLGYLNLALSPATPFTPDELPGNLANAGAVRDYIDHVETTPFLSGP